MSGHDERREGGFLAIHRRLRSWPVWQGMTALQQRVWLEMLFEANWKQTEITVAEGRVVIHRGEYVTTQENLARLAKVSRKVVRQTYALAEADGAIRHRAVGTGVGRRKGRRVIATTIVNYSKYQDLQDQEGHRRATEGPHQNQGNQGNQEAFPSATKNLKTVFPSDTRAEGRVIKLNPDDCLYDWDPELQMNVPRGLTAHGREVLRKGRG